MNRAYRHMRGIGFALLFSAGSTMAYAEPFSVVCSEFDLGGGRTTRTPYKVAWNGSALQSVGTDLSGRIDQTDEKVLSFKRLEPLRLGGLKYSFHTGIHATKLYRYYTTVEVVPDRNGPSLVVMYATTDQEGYLVSAFSSEYRVCQLLPK